MAFSIVCYNRHEIPYHVRDGKVIIEPTPITGKPKLSGESQAGDELEDRTCFEGIHLNQQVQGFLTHDIA